MVKKLLIVVDYQVDFVCGSLGFAGAKDLEGPICEKIAQYREEEADIVYTMDTHDSGYGETQEGRLLPIAHCMKGSEGWELYGKVRELLAKNTVCFEKPCFGSEELAAYVHKKGYSEIELCGLVSNICVISNAVLVKAALPEATVLVDAQCTACADSELNSKALDVMQGLQILILNR